MKNFELFVDEIVSKWFSEKKVILESAGLAGISNRETGDLAEDYILRKIKGLPQNYIGKKSKGSRTPIDVFAVARRGGYWHIMLIQVKSSEYKDKIYKLNQNEIKVLNEFAKFFKKEFTLSKLLRNYKDSSIMFSTGYAGVFSDKKTNRNYLQETKKFNSFKKNMGNQYGVSVELNISLAHSLSS